MQRKPMSETLAEMVKFVSDNQGVIKLSKARNLISVKISRLTNS